MVTTSEELLSKPRDNSSYQASSHSHNTAVRSGDPPRGGVYLESDSQQNIYQHEAKEHAWLQSGAPKN